MAEPAPAGTLFSLDSCLEGLKHAGCCVKMVCVCTCCFACIGPIILIVGIIMIALPNSRADNVSEYNAAIQSYDPSPIRAMANSSSTIGGTAVHLETSQIVVDGDLEGVDANGYSSLLQASLTVTTGAAITYNVRNVDSFTRYPTRMSTTAVDMPCTSSNGCTASMMQSKCINDYSGTYTGSGCTADTSACGSCRYTSYLDTYCVVVSAKGDLGGTTNEFSEDSSVKSCFYPFSKDSQKYGLTSPSSPSTFQVRLKSDPFIALQRLTEGDEDFGITAKQQRVAGLVLLIIGAIVIVIVVVVGYLVHRCVKSALETKSQYQRRRAPAVGIPMEQITPAPGSVVSPGGPAQYGYGNRVAPAAIYHPENHSIVTSGVYDDKPPGYGNGAYAEGGTAYASPIPYGQQPTSVPPAQMNPNGDYEV